MSNNLQKTILKEFDEKKFRQYNEFDNSFEKLDDEDEIKQFIISALKRQHQADMEEAEKFLSKSSVWDSDYIYLRKATMLEKFKKYFK